MQFRLLLLLAAFAIVGCAHQSVVSVAPAYNVASSYNDKIPGSWALYVDADDLEAKDLHMKGFECSAHSFPIAAGSAFAQSSLRTLSNVMEEVNLVERPLSHQDLEKQGYAGHVLLKGEELDGDLVVITGFWSNKIEAEVDMAVSVRVDGRQGRLLGTTVSGDDEAILDAGAFCGGGAKAVSEAGEGALKKVMQAVAESISNSPRIREYAGGQLAGSARARALPAANAKGSMGALPQGQLLGLVEVERIAKEQNCNAPELLKQEYKVEIYDVVCPGGNDLIVRCDWGTCELIY